MAHWPACLSKNMAHSRFCLSQRNEDRAYKGGRYQCPSIIPFPPSPPRLLWYLPKHNHIKQQCVGAWLGDGAISWNPLMMAVGWIPCLESFPRPRAPS